MTAYIMLYIYIFFLISLTCRYQMRATRSSLKVNILDIPRIIPHNGSTIITFAVAGLRLWNINLDDELPACTNVEIFKKINLRHYGLSHFY